MHLGEPIRTVIVVPEREPIPERRPDGVPAEPQFKPYVEPEPQTVREDK
jgi:hypothetical protein